VGKGKGVPAHLQAEEAVFDRVLLIDLLNLLTSFQDIKKDLAQG
jgi:hypothetical protein